MEQARQSSKDERRWKAIVQRDHQLEETYFYGVITTGIYCRPGCSAKTPNRENVVIFDSSAEAEQQGYRPCRKCRPELKKRAEEQEAKIIAACRRLEKDRNLPTLERLAGEAGLSPSHFHRLFTKIIGVTPRQYYLKHRSDRLREELAGGVSVSEAIYSAGFESLSGAYNRNDDRLAMTPKAYKKGAAGVEIIYDTAQCFLGTVLVAATSRGICSVELGDSEEQVGELLRSRFPNAAICRGEQNFRDLVDTVVGQLENPEQMSELPLDVQGTAFQQKVWNVLRTLKPGDITSYSSIAEQIGQPEAIRAVASACAANKLAVLIPCHRVLRKDKKNSGYRWGKERKRLLLEKEKK